MADAARSLIARGFRVVPIAHKFKRPRLLGWTSLRIGLDDVGDHFGDGPANVGVMLGEPSGWLVDVDLDCDEAVELADEMLPPTGAVSGREGRERSHRWYIAEGAETRRWSDPVAGGAIVELRSTGAQTVVGPSVHPDGSRYHPLEGEPARLDAAELAEALNELAASVVQIRHPSRKPEAPTLPPVAPTRDNAASRAAAYLDRMPASISGANGHSAAYAAATAMVHGFELDEAEAFAILWERFNPRCDPPWSEKEIRHKVNQAATKPHKRERGWLLRARDDADGLIDLSGILGNAKGVNAPAVGAEASAWMTADQLVAMPQSPPLIDGMLREGEIANIIAAPKTGKSWLSLDLAITAAMGGRWLGRFEVDAGGVVLVDNELKPGTLGHRFGMACKARNIRPSAVTNIRFTALRGGLRDLHAVFDLLGQLEPEQRRIAILDAWYRFLPAGSDENSNTDITKLYNTLDTMAEALGTAFVLIHHTSKGGQGSRAVTDVGAGAGSQSRAADTHLVIREHQEAGPVVVDAAVRSLPPLAPFVLRREFPQFIPADDESQAAIKGAGPNTETPGATMKPIEFVARFIDPEGSRWPDVEAKATAAGLSARMAKKKRDEAEVEGLIHKPGARTGPGPWVPHYSAVVATG